MPLTPDDLFARLDALGIETRTVTHPPLHTVEESQALRGELAGCHCKCLFLKNKRGAMWLVVAREEAAIDLKSLAKALDAGRLSFASAGRLRETLGVEPGSVTPFSLANDTENAVQPVLDAAMLAHGELNYHPLTNTMTTTIARDDLLKFIEATGHTPQVMDLPEPEAG